MSTPNGFSEDLDVLIVGAGFSGLYQLPIYRKLGYNVKVFDNGADIGGTWYWNRYPGARVDSPVPIYSFSAEELWKDWNWTEKYPGWQEIRAYFKFVEEKLGLKKDISFNTRVVSAEWDDEEHRWTVKTDTGVVVHPRFLVLATGALSIPYTPAFKGLEKFEGICHHTGQWPEEGVDVKGKRVAVIGTGSTGVQVIQEVGPEVGHLTVFQRTPNLCLPMGQEKLDLKTRAARKDLYPTIFRFRLQSALGFDYNPFPKEYVASTPEERILRLEEHWAGGGFRSVAAFTDTGINQEANDGVYAFWQSKVRARLRDPKMQEKLAPTIPPHPLGGRRPSLEQTYYEVFNQDNVDLNDLNENPIAEFTSKGIITGDGQEHEFDVIVLATGWDSVTGSMTNINLRGVGGQSIAEKWKDGVYTNLGMTTSGFPNMFFTYGPQAPTAFSNGPSCIEPQGDWISGCIRHMKENDLTKIDATPEAEQNWRGMVMGIYDKLLMKKARGWWNGANIPGKPVELLSFPGGIPTYFKICTETAEKGYEGFVLSTNSK
ncbi:cyclohexanone monooxygenase [Marasmius fiardii PR-910]|nr:cyclohexanone monooxygenase [Marasmius fiardii PR-910]